MGRGVRRTEVGSGGLWKCRSEKRQTQDVDLDRKTRAKGARLLHETGRIVLGGKRKNSRTPGRKALCSEEPEFEDASSTQEEKNVSGGGVGEGPGVTSCHGGTITDDSKQPENTYAKGKGRDGTKPAQFSGNVESAAVSPKARAWPVPFVKNCPGPTTEWQNIYFNQN